MKYPGNYSPSGSIESLFHVQVGSKELDYYRSYLIDQLQRMESKVGEMVWQHLIQGTIGWERGNRRGVNFRYPRDLTEAAAVYKKHEEDIDVEARRIASSLQHSLRAIDEAGHESVAMQSSVLSSLRKEIVNPLVRHEVWKILLSKENEPRS